jgi:hypothetical protein
VKALSFQSKVETNIYADFSYLLFEIAPSNDLELSDLLYLENITDLSVKTKTHFGAMSRGASEAPTLRNPCDPGCQQRDTYRVAGLPFSPSSSPLYTISANSCSDNKAVSHFIRTSIGTPKYTIPLYIATSRFGCPLSRFVTTMSCQILRFSFHLIL